MFQPTTIATRMLAIAVAVGAGLAWSGVAQAKTGDRIGDAVSVVNTVTVSLHQAKRVLAPGDDVRQDELVEVATDALGELKLDDDTKLALGPGSRLLLDRFVYDSDKHAGSIIVNLTKGAFRFITGVATKPSYVIKVPNASITVRGTIFDGYILRDNSVWLLLHEGAIEVTNASGRCRVLDRPGHMLRVTSSGAVGTPVVWNKLPGKSAAPFDAAFPFVTSAPTIDPTPRFNRTEVEGANFVEAKLEPCVNPVRATGTRRADKPNPPTLRKAKPQRADVVKRPPRAVRRADRSDSDSSAAATAAAVGLAIGIVRFGGGGRGYRGGGGGGRGGGGDGGGRSVPMGHGSR